MTLPAVAGATDSALGEAIKAETPPGYEPVFLRLQGTLGALVVFKPIPNGSGSGTYAGDKNIQFRRQSDGSWAVQSRGDNDFLTVMYRRLDPVAERRY